jgi:hypothetical protein
MEKLSETEPKRVPKTTRTKPKGSQGTLKNENLQNNQLLSRREFRRPNFRKPNFVNDVLCSASATASQTSLGFVPSEGDVVAADLHVVGALGLYCCT